MNQDNGCPNADELFSNEQSENEVRPEPPTLVHLLIFAVISVIASLTMPELGILSVIVLSACVIFITSGGAPVPVQIIPAAGVPALLFRGGYFWLALAAVTWLASFVAGYRLLRGKTFQQALMPYMLILLSAAALGGAVYTRIEGISSADISDAMRSMIHDMMASAIESAGDSIDLETAYLLTEQYEAMAATAAVFIPAVVGFAVSLAGIFALRIAGVLHNISGSDYYPMPHRVAAVDRVFAAVWLVSLLIGVLDPTGVVGACASNVMMILLFPAVAAGITECRFMIIRRRLSGRRGLPFFLILLIFSFLITSPVVGLIVLALMGTFSAFFKVRIIIRK